MEGVYVQDKVVVMADLFHGTISQVNGDGGKPVGHQIYQKATA